MLWSQMLNCSEVQICLLFLNQHTDPFNYLAIYTYLPRSSLFFSHFAPSGVNGWEKKCLHLSKAQNWLIRVSRPDLWLPAQKDLFEVMDTGNSSTLFCWSFKTRKIDKKYAYFSRYLRRKNFNWILKKILKDAKR